MPAGVRRPARGAPTGATVTAVAPQTDSLGRALTINRVPGMTPVRIGKRAMTSADAPCGCAGGSAMGSAGDGVGLALTGGGAAGCVNDREGGATGGAPHAASAMTKALLMAR